MSEFWSQDKISAYLDGELSQAERVRVEQHLSENSADAETLREYLVLRGEFQKVPRFELDKQFPSRVLRAIANAQKARTPHSPMTDVSDSPLPPQHLSTPQHREQHPSRQSPWRSAAAVMAALAATLMLSTFLVPQPRTRVGWDAVDAAPGSADNSKAQLENQEALPFDSESDLDIGVVGDLSGKASASGEPAKSISSSAAELRDSNLGDSNLGQANQAGESSPMPAPMEIKDLAQEKTISPNRIQLQNDNRVAQPATGRGNPNALNKPLEQKQELASLQENTGAGIVDAESGMADKIGQSVADRKQASAKNASEGARDSESEESQPQALAGSQTGRYRRSAGKDVTDQPRALEEKDDLFRSEASPGQQPIAANQTARLAAENVLHLRITPTRQNQVALDLLLRGQLDDPQVSKNLFARAEIRDNLEEDQILEQAPENLFKKMADLESAGSSAQLDADKPGGYGPDYQSTDGRQTQFVQVFASEAEISQLLGQVGGEITRFELTPDRNDLAKTQPPTLGRGGGGGFGAGGGAAGDAGGSAGGSAGGGAGAAAGGGNKASDNLNLAPAGEDGPALVQRFTASQIELAFASRGVAADDNNRARGQQQSQDRAAGIGLESETLKRDEAQPDSMQPVDSLREVRKNYWLLVEIVSPVTDAQAQPAESIRAVPAPGAGKDK